MDQSRKTPRAVRPARGGKKRVVHEQNSTDPTTKAARKLVSAGVGTAWAHGPRSGLPIIIELRRIIERGRVTGWAMLLAGCDRPVLLTTTQLLSRRRFDQQTAIQLRRIFAPRTQLGWILLLRHAMERRCVDEVVS